MKNYSGTCKLPIMFKSLLLVLLMFISSDVLFAQQNDLEIQGTSNNLYVEHTVSPKENFYSLGRTYNVNPKELASYNHLHFQSGLDIGQIMKIPLTKMNFTQSTKVEPNYALVPVYHTVVAGETLYRLGVNYNKVSLASLKKWNNMSTDAVSVGSKMIVGYLKVDKNLSSLENRGSNTASTEVVKEQKEPNPILPAKPEPAPQKITESAPVSQPNQEAKKAAQPAVSMVEKSNGGFSGGVFKQLYAEQTGNKSNQNRNGTGGVFKSTSGWQDGKYYCFSNDATAGTVLKITNNATRKVIFAKVLDTIPAIQQNEGLIVLISNAAASELGAGDNKFDCVVNF